MPFNGSGTFSIINTFIPGTTILSAAVNQNFTDIATGLSDVLTRDGQAGMTAVLKVITGSSANPSIAATSDTKTGIYFPATGVLGLVANALGVKVNSEVFSALSATPNAAGANYNVGDTVTLSSTASIIPTVLTVATISGGAILSVSVTVPGVYLTKLTNPASAASTSGSGSGGTFTVTYNDPTSSAFKLGLTDLTNAALWPALGASPFVAGLLAKANGLDFANGIGSANLLAATGVSAASQASFKNLSVKVATNTTVTVAADAVVLKNSTTGYFLATSVSATCNLGSAGAVNTLDTGTIATNSWYYIYVIYNGTTTGTLASVSSTSPTLPSGYTYSARIGAVQTINTSATLYGTWQFGRDAQYVVGLAQTTVIPNMANGVTGTFSTTAPTYAAQSVIRFVPATASRIRIGVTGKYNNGTASGVQVAPNSSYSGGSTTNPPPLQLDAGATLTMPVDMLLESTNISWTASAAGGGISCLGWQDNI